MIDLAMIPIARFAGYGLMVPTFEFANVFMGISLIASAVVLLGLVLALIAAMISTHIDNRRRINEFVDECKRLDAARRAQGHTDDDFWGSP